MRYSAAEKLEITRLVEQSSSSVRRTATRGRRRFAEHRRLKRQDRPSRLASLLPAPPPSRTRRPVEP
jgi:transposase-like protein